MGDLEKENLNLSHSGGIDAVDAVEGFPDWQSTAHPSNNGLLVEDLDGDGDLDVAAAFLRYGPNLHMLDAATGEALIDAIVLDGHGETGTIQLAAGDFSPQAGTEVAVSTMVTTGVFGTVMQTWGSSSGSDSSSSSSGGGGCFISTIR